MIEYPTLREDKFCFILKAVAKLHPMTLPKININNPKKPNKAPMIINGRNSLAANVYIF